MNLLTRVNIKNRTEAFDSGFDKGYTKGFTAGVLHAETQATAARRRGW